MAVLSEFAIVKLCVEKPATLDRTLKQLNLRFIRDPQQPDIGEVNVTEKLEDSEATTTRKTSHLFYSVWSAVTKCLRNIVQGHQKAIEIPNFAVFGPVLDKF